MLQDREIEPGDDQHLKVPRREKYLRIASDPHSQGAERRRRFSRLNFQAVDERDAKAELRRMVLMTKGEFSLA